MAWLWMTPTLTVDHSFDMLYLGYCGSHMSHPISTMLALHYAFRFK
jgi:hypothetical protein